MTEERLPSYFCVSCGLTVSVTVMGCPRCGLVGGWLWIGRGRPGRWLSEVSSAVELVATGDGALDAALAGGFAKTSCVAVIGGPGVGKSTICGRWAFRLAMKLGGPVCYVGWEASDEIAGEALRRGGVDAERVWMTGRDDWEVEADAVGAKVVVVDSISARSGVSELQRASDWATSTEGIALALCQVTGDGDARGGPGVEHWASAALWCEQATGGANAMVSWTKCRWARPGKVLVPLVGRAGGGDEGDEGAAATPRAGVAGRLVGGGASGARVGGGR